MTTPARKVCFLYIAQTHQILHSLTIAVELARGWPRIEVEIATTTQPNLDYVTDALAQLGGAKIHTRLLGPAWLRALRIRGASTPPKVAMLMANLGVLSTYDALITPERTTTMVRRMGVRRPRLIYTQHGAGDRGGTFEPRLGQFDLVMAAGPKYRDRMVENGLVETANVAVVGYPKFDMVDAIAPEPASPFSDGRPVVLYNPHFDPSISSWPRWGLEVLQQFADQDRFNLIFAPHIRLFDGAGSAGRRLVERFADSPRIHVDLDGPAMIDMTYTRLADIYLGDVSSQLYEFLRRPGPTVFLNAHGVAWRDDESYRNWRFGPVLDSLDGLVEAVGASVASHCAYRAEQQQAFDETFDLQAVSSSRRAAQAIVECLDRP